MNDSLQPYIDAAVTIVVDTNFPERAEHRPFKIYRFQGHEEATGPNRGRVSMGFIIKLNDLDPRWLKGNNPPVQAWHLGGSKVLAMTPSTDYPHLHDMEAEERGLTFAGIDDNIFLQPVNITRTEILEAELRKFHFFILSFPEDLDNDPYSPKARNGKILREPVPILSTWEEEVPKADGVGMTKVPVASARSNVQWKIAVAETKKKSTVAPAPETNEMAGVMNNFWASMSLNDADDDDEVVDEED